jgi:esterase/lipase superfamily enzyme
VYFLTNRVLKQSTTSDVPRKVSFDLNDPNALQSLFFCQRTKTGQYTELGSERFLKDLRDSKYEQLLLYLHGFASFPENPIFQRAELLQQFFDERKKHQVQVVPVIWPCLTDEVGFRQETIQGYFSDQQSADASGFAYARALAKLLDWQRQNAEKDESCLKRINVLAHSMGNRVLRQALGIWCRQYLSDSPPLLFRNVFMAAADVVNESLEEGKEGQEIPQASRNVVVYFASDDLALRASKAANLRNRIASRRLGHTGPEDMTRVPRNVYAVDCDNFNLAYDPFKGHTYFVDASDPKNPRPGAVFQHLAECIDKGRVPPELVGVTAQAMAPALTILNA